MKQLNKEELTKIDGGWPDLTLVGVIEEFVDLDLNGNGQVGVFGDGWPFF